MISFTLGLLFVSWIGTCIVQAGLAGQSCIHDSQCPKGQTCSFPEKNGIYLLLGTCKECSEDKDCPKGQKCSVLFLAGLGTEPKRWGQCEEDPLFGKCFGDKDCDPGYQCMAKVHIPLLGPPMFGECEMVANDEKPVEPMLPELPGKSCRGHEDCIWDGFYKCAEG